MHKVVPAGREAKGGGKVLTFGELRTSSPPTFMDSRGTCTAFRNTTHTHERERENLIVSVWRNERCVLNGRLCRGKSFAVRNRGMQKQRATHTLIRLVSISPRSNTPPSCPARYYSTTTCRCNTYNSRYERVYPST